MQDAVVIGGIDAAACKYWMLRYGLSSYDLWEAIIAWVQWPDNTYTHCCLSPTYRPVQVPRFLPSRNEGYLPKDVGQVHTQGLWQGFHQLL